MPGAGKDDEGGSKILGAEAKGIVSKFGSAFIGWTLRREELTG